MYLRSPGESHFNGVFYEASFMVCSYYTKTASTKQTVKREYQQLIDCNMATYGQKYWENGTKREKAQGKSCRFIHICDGEKEDLTEEDQSVQTSGGEEQDERDHGDDPTHHHAIPKDGQSSEVSHVNSTPFLSTNILSYLPNKWGVVQKLLHYFSCTFYPLLASSPRF